MLRGEEEERPLVSVTDMARLTYQTMQTSEPPGKDDENRSITTLQSIAFLTNTVVGPGMLMLPFMFEQGGVVPSIVALMGFGAFAFCTACAFARLVDDMQETSNHRLEYVPLVRRVFGHRWAWLSLFFLVLGLLAQLVASIVVSAQAMDKLLVLSFGGSVGLQLSPSVETVVFTESECPMTGSCHVFAESNAIISMGYVLVSAFTAPFCLLALRETMVMQLASYMLTILVTVAVMGDFLAGPLHTSSMEAVGDHQKYIIGIVIFNLMLAPYIPSWCHERVRTVKTSVVMGGTLTGTTILFVALGVAGALRYPGITGSVLHAMTSTTGSVAMPMIADVFILLMVATGIPEYAVIIRYCLEDAIGYRAAMAVALSSFVVCWSMYKDHYFFRMLNWSGLVAGSLSSFVVPLIVCAYARSRSQLFGIKTDRLRQWEGYLCIAMMALVVPSVLFCMASNTMSTS